MVPHRTGPTLCMPNSARFPPCPAYGRLRHAQTAVIYYNTKPCQLQGGNARPQGGVFFAHCGGKRNRLRRMAAGNAHPAAKHTAGFPCKFEKATPSFGAARAKGTEIKRHSLYSPFYAALKQIFQNAAGKKIHFPCPQKIIHIAAAKRQKICMFLRSFPRKRKPDL